MRAAINQRVDVAVQLLNDTLQHRAISILERGPNFWRQLTIMTPDVLGGDSAVSVPRIVELGVQLRDRAARCGQI